MLGPLLFLIYINDLSEGIHSSKLALFADDTSVIKAGNRNDISIEEDINSLTNWFTKNKLSVNLDKCEVVPFGSGKPLEITMMSKKIPFNKSCRYLGVHIDSRLRFHEHINRVVKKLNKFCGLIYRIRHYYNKKCLLMFYNSFAKSVICYGLLIYGTSAKSNLRKIEMAQRRILRGIFFKKKYDSISNILRRNGVLTVFELYIVEVMKELFRQLQSKSPNLLLSNIEATTNDKIERRSKQKNLLPLTWSRTIVKQKCLTNVLIKCHNWLKQFNLLPEDLATMSKTQTMKLTQKISSLYVVDNEQLVTLFF